MDGGNTTRAFARSLAALKRQGCSLLITGPARDGSHLQLSRQLMGDTDTESRWRLVVATDTRGTGTRCPDATDTRRYRLIDRRPAMRSSAVRACPSAPLNLFALEREVCETINEFDVAADGLSSGELRVCVDSLQPLVDIHGTQSVERFIGTIAERIDDTSGMGHFHLPVDSECSTVSAFSPLFDVHIELREGKHRWHILEEDIHTDWLRI